MAWDFETEPEFQQKLDWMRAFIDRDLIPLEPILRELPADEWALVRRHLQQQVKDQGLWACHLDPELGGAGFGQMKLALMHELIGRCMYSMEIFGNQAPDSGNTELLAAGANEAQKERWLWPNIEGRLRSAFALTEPFEAGADPTRLRTQARRDGDEWVIDGHKWFCTNGSFADFLIVMAETNPEGRPHRHASMFVVEKGTQGMNIVRDIPTMAHPEPVYGELGNHAEIRFEGCRVPHENLIGQPGDGFVLAQNNAISAARHGEALRVRLEAAALPAIEPVVRELDDLALGRERFDAINDDVVHHELRVRTARALSAPLVE